MNRARLIGVFNELMRRKVVRVTVGYAVVVWILLQIAEVTFQPLHLPDWALTLMVVVAIIGFPVAAILAWAFEVTPDGLKRDAEDVQAKTGNPVPRDTFYRSVAVLPFADMSPGNDQSYFCEGIAEEVLCLLSSVRCLRVPARTSSFRFNPGKRDIRAIGKALDVDAVLEGSVRKDGKKVRITAQLIDARSGYHIWANSYDRHLSGVLSVQKELAEEIVRRLCESLSPEDTVIREPASAADIRAYDYYLQGRHYLHRFSEQSVELSIKMFRNAVDIDPKYALAWAGLAEAHAYLYIFHESSWDHLEEARGAAEKAVELAPDSPPCRTVAGTALMLAGKYAEADVEFDAALAMNPMLFSASYYYARSCQAQGKLEQAAELFEQASLRRPEDYQAPLLALSIYRSLGEKRKAKSAARRGIDAAKLHLSLHPDDGRALYLGALGLLETGKTDEAIRWIEKAIRLDPNDALTRYNAACFYAQIGDKDQAFTNLSLANNSSVAFASWMQHDPDLKILWDDPRFIALQETGETSRHVSALAG